MMKKFLSIAVLGAAGLMSAKNSKTGQHFKTNEKISTKLIEYQYLYQSTCGWTFTMISSYPIETMTPAQYRNYMADVLDKNNHTCKLHGQKLTYDFTLNQNLSDVKNERI
ncbi:hypothetical protein M2347_003047 [Chryseobacterium sp. H1D6B]|uniref:hypothetical protein n=1 Tax=Chryseobacterium sp. H1D6B TaxID=2940588 RepID=UPI0015CBE5DB|nr:hypothetical protein [Chryseobacterium sp. H1D6B]MDH6253320.1 hypothetical protein [Chryseobacterium sp. H1D6B]